MDFRRVTNNAGAVGDAIGRHLDDIKGTFDIDFGRRDLSVQGRRFPFLAGMSNITFNRRNPEGESHLGIVGYSPMESGRKAFVDMYAPGARMSVQPSATDAEDFGLPMLDREGRSLGVPDHDAINKRWGTTLYSVHAPHALSEIESVMDAMNRHPVSEGTLRANQRDIMNFLHEQDRMGLSPEEISMDVFAPGAKHINDTFSRRGAFHLGTGRFRFISEEKNAKIRASKPGNLG